MAPADIRAVAVVADGTVLPVGPSTDDGRGRTGPVRVTCLVDRRGYVAARIHLAGRPTSADPPSGGRLLDSMHRVLGLPTLPPDRSSSVMVARVWVGAVADATREGMVALGWKQVRRLHPAAAVVAASGLDVTDDLIDTARRLAPDAWSWEWLRQQAAEGRGGGLVAPELADWMDEGMFSRWILDETRPAADLLAQARPGLSTDAFDRLQAAISLDAATG